MTHEARRVSAHPLRWSFLMLPAFLILFIIASLLEAATMQAVGLTEGDLLLMDKSAVAWIVAILLFALTAAAPLVGIWLGLRATRDGERRPGGTAWRGWVALALNAAVLALLVYGFVDQVRMSYWPG